jgi:type IV secretory pathway ATPase VirB11/archaellum biosynthesis ATPase
VNNRSGRSPHGGQLLFRIPPVTASGQILDSYKVGLFDIQIIQNNPRRRLYLSKLASPHPRLSALLVDVMEVLEEMQPVPDQLPNSLDDFLNFLEAIVSPHLAELGSGAAGYARLLSYEFVGLGRLLPLFDDPAVDEFFLDSPFSPPYIEHRRHGRLDLPFLLTRREIDAIRTHTEIYGNQSASLGTPSLKSELKLGGVKARVGMDLAPVAVSGIALHIRKVGANALTLPSLIVRGCITLDVAAFILAMVRCRINITIVGPSGTGKTTLLNAIDMASDPELRRVYIEDAVESLDLSDWGYRQLKLRVQPLETGNDAERSKMKEVLKALHRSPDMLILGEIQDSLQSQALFQALESGIVGLQTFHSTSPEQAVRRWTKTHSIHEQQLRDLGIIVTMFRPNLFSSQRIVQRVSVLDRDLNVLDIFNTSCPNAAIHTGFEDGIFKIQAATRDWLAEAIRTGRTEFDDFIDFVRCNPPREVAALPE